MAVNRRNIFGVLSSAVAFLALTPATLAAAVRDAREAPPTTDEEALALLKRNGIVSPNMTWPKMEAIAAKLGLNGSGPEGAANRWTFIVKGKWIYRDDAK